MTIDYRMIIEAAPEAIIVYTPEKFLFLNEFAASRLGSDPASLVGEPIMQFVHPESVPVVIQRLQEVTKTGETGPPLEVRFVSRTGDVIPSEIISVRSCSTVRGRSSVSFVTSVAGPTPSRRFGRVRKNLPTPFASRRTEWRLLIPRESSSKPIALSARCWATPKPS